MLDFSFGTGLAGLFFASLLAATVLPGGSEFALVAFIANHPDRLAVALAVATFGNTLGALFSYQIGRMLPNRVSHTGIVHLQRFGYWALLFAWLPIVGDGLCVAAGWLRFEPRLTTLLLAIGKLLRYLAVVGGWVLIDETSGVLAGA